VSIEELGWDDYFQAHWSETGNEGRVPARIVSQHRGLWRVAGDFEECWAEASGALRTAGENGADWPAVGDWVSAELRRGQSAAIIQRVLPRRSRFVRKAAGKQLAAQVIAANIDLAAIVAGLDGDFNARRIERYVAQCWASGARPVVVLNKADVCAAHALFAAEIERIAIGVQVFVVSAKMGEGMEALERTFARGQTMVLLGSSGAGKSTLVNRLMREDRQATNPVREKDRRGRHTTTSRQLFLLPCGALIVDTPGLRELQLWNAGEGLSQTFSDIDELACECRFRDCMHTSEPGCAVQAALASGKLDAARLESKRKLEREQQFLERKVDPEVRHAAKLHIRTVMRQVRQDYRERDKGKN
jgi:ribosome biogenesis GTPase / thiamine phosphate phosphatase